ASLDGQGWEDSDAIEAVIERMTDLPHLKPITVAFFRGALATWVKFSSEFAPGGLIDEASPTERQLAWMPSTNDANEGSLGQYRVKMRKSPTLTLHQFNAEVMYNRNDTQEFMDTLFEPPDHLYIMRTARKEDASGLERKQKTVLADFRVRLAQMKKQKDILKRQKEIEDLRTLLQVKLVSSIAQIYDMTRGLNLSIKKLHQQLDAFRLRGVPDIKANSNYAKKADKQAALVVALQKFQLCPELYPVPQAVLLKVSAAVLQPITQIIKDHADEEDIEMDE
ncbi:hypothetical protein B0H10DRAFT_1803172, partial [Mycena sp. CBHHK59/15]